MFDIDQINLIALGAFVLLIIATKDNRTRRTALLRALITGVLAVINGVQAANGDLFNWIMLLAWSVLSFINFVAFFTPEKLDNNKE